VTTGIPYTEDFEDGVANGWVDGYDSDGVQSLPVWTIVTDGASKVYEEPTVESDPSWAVGGNRAWTDQHLEAKAKFVSGSADGLITLVVRFVTFKTYCFLELHSNQIKIRVKNNGSTTDIGVAYKFPTPLVDGTWYQVGLAVQGSNLTAYFGGMPVATGPMPAAAVPALTAGGIALTATDSVAAFDDVSVTLP
jgi:hypothetical protein